jgi:Holliday junction resolvase RusA-like endonuclease
VTTWSEQQLAEYLAGKPVAAQKSANANAARFALPVSSEPIVLDLPVPISVNKLRRINWKAQERASMWKDRADRHLLAAKVRPDNPVRCLGIERFEIEITLDDDKVVLDLDNALKLLIDYLRHRNIIKDDSKKHMRKLTVMWGSAPAGCQVRILPLCPTQ